MKKIFLMGLSLVLVAVLSIGGTLAYPVSQERDINLNPQETVKIQQIEQEWNGAGTVLTSFTQDKPLLPYVGELGWKTGAGNNPYRQFAMNNVVDKYVSVKNTGTADVYVRTIIALEMGAYSLNEFNMIGISANLKDGSEFQFPGTWGMKDLGMIKIDGLQYNLIEFVHEDALGPGEQTIPSLLQVYLDKDADNETCEKLDGNRNGKYDILALSQAVQTGSFTDAQTALDAAFGKTFDSAASWLSKISSARTITSAAELRAILTGGAEVVLTADVDLTGQNWTPIEAEDFPDAEKIVINGNGKTIKGLNAPLIASTPEGNREVAVSGLTISHSEITGGNQADVGAFIGVGRSNVTITDCTVENCIIRGTGSVGGIMGFAGKVSGTVTTIENCTVRNCTLISANDSYRVGTVVGTANNGKVVIGSITSEGNTLSQVNNGAEVARPDTLKNNLYGRFEPNNTGTLIIDDVNIT